MATDKPTLWNAHVEWNGQRILYVTATLDIVIAAVGEALADVRPIHGDTVTVDLRPLI